MVSFSKERNKYTYIYIYKFQIKEVESNENDISAEEAFQSKSSWIQSKNEHGRRKKSSGSQKSKRKKKIISVGRIYVAFSSIQNEKKRIVCLP